MEKLAVITGASRGIGKAIALKLAQNNFCLAMSAQNPARLAGLRDRLKDEFPNQEFHIFPADLSKKNEVLAFADSVIETGVPVDILVNNCGIYIPGQVHSEPDGRLEQLIETNLYSAYHLTRALSPGMKKHKGGHVFNICSTASLTPFPDGGSYAISKFAMYGFSKALREEFKQFGIRVTSVLPGPVYTDSWEGANLPESRFMKPADVAEALWAAFSVSGQTVLEEIILRPQLGDI
ncbi:MAG: SDR family oxidoreductase [Bacteroidota bacterium]